MANIFPAGISWGAVTVNVGDFLALSLVTGGILFLLALRFGPKAIQALFRVFRHA